MITACAYCGEFLEWDGQEPNGYVGVLATWQRVSHGCCESCMRQNRPGMTREVHKAMVSGLQSLFIERRWIAEQHNQGSE